MCSAFVFSYKTFHSTISVDLVLKMSCVLLQEPLLHNFSFPPGELGVRTPYSMLSLAIQVIT